MKKAIIFLGSLFFTLNVLAQEDLNSISNNDKTVTITVIGQGKTIDEAKTNALRSAIEQAFGAFISTNTTILNDSLVRDEIVSVANGNIQKFEILNQTILPDGTNMATLKAIVSVNKLTSFCESKGVKVEFKGGLFAMNIALQELNKKSEKIAWENIFRMITTEIPISYSYKIDAHVPILSDSVKWLIPIQVYVNSNDNYDAIVKQVVNFANSVSLSTVETQQYTNSKIPFFYLKINEKDYFFRNDNILNDLKKIPALFLKDAIQNLEISNGVDNYSLLNLCIKSPQSDIKLFSNIFFGEGYCWWGGSGKPIRYSILGNDWMMNPINKIELRELINDKSEFTISNSNHFDIGGGSYDCLINSIDFNLLKGELTNVKYTEVHTIDEIKNITSYTIKKRS